MHWFCVTITASLFVCIYVHAGTSPMVYSGLSNGQHHITLVATYACSGAVVHHIKFQITWIFWYDADCVKYHKTPL